MRIEGNKRSSLLRALDIFLYDRSCVAFARERSRDFSTLYFGERDAGKTTGERKERKKPFAGEEEPDVTEGR